MTDTETLLFAGILLLFLVRWFLKSRKKQPRRILIRERLIKILYNPFVEKWMWTKFNPKTRTWEWQRIATEQEIEKYKDVVLSEVPGQQVLDFGENHNG